MPLTTDERILSLSRDLIQQFDTIFGLHPGFRPAHAKGALMTGVFRPSAEAASLTRAPHMNRASTPVTARFSDSTGLPAIADMDANASPHGLAVRFHLAEHVHTDIIGHTVDGFPTRTGAEFLEMLRAAAASGDPAAAHPAPIEQFLGSHPAALAFVRAPKPAPASFASETYFGVTAMQFSNAGGASRYGRYRIVPEDGNQFLDEKAVASKGPNYLFDELASRANTSPVRFHVDAQLADEGDVTDNATVHWPEDRGTLRLGAIELTRFISDSAAEQRQIIFDPIPRVDGIDPSSDPLLELRAAIYLMSGRRRRGAGSGAPA
jgi:catalase